MREVTTTTRYYAFDELSEDAQARAIEAVRNREAEVFWHDPDERGRVIVYGIAEALKSPGWDTFGVGDFPGIDGFQLTAWDFDRQHVEGSGTLTRETAPALPWGRFVAYHFSGRHTVAHGDLADGEEFDDGSAYVISTDRDAEFDTLDQAVRDALHDGWVMLDQEYEYATGEEWAREQASDTDFFEFSEDGDLL